MSAVITCKIVFLLFNMISNSCLLTLILIPKYFSYFILIVIYSVTLLCIDWLLMIFRNSYRFFNVIKTDSHKNVKQITNTKHKLHKLLNFISSAQYRCKLLNHITLSEWYDEKWKSSKHRVLSDQVSNNFLFMFSCAIQSSDVFLFHLTHLPSLFL